MISRPGLTCRAYRWLLVLPLFGGALTAQEPPVDDALPLVGTAGHGHTYPGATRPFGFVQLSPDTRIKGWDGCSGYHYSDSTILGFSHTHLSGTGGAALGEVSIMPVAGPLDLSAPLTDERFKSPFSHAREGATPGYYRVWLDRYSILAELTATAHCGLHRYTFPAAGERHLLVDLVHAIGNNRATAAGLKVAGPTRLTGYRDSVGWAHGFKAIYFAIESSQPFAGYGFESDDKPAPPGTAELTGKNLRAHLDFAPSGPPVELRVGLSPTSVQEAEKNLAAEVPRCDFDAVRAAARADWNSHLSRVAIDCDNPNVRQTFYSAMYHTMMAPTLYNDADGSYFGADRAVHPEAKFQCYSTFSLWDVFRAELPLLTLTEPDRVNDFAQSLLAEYHESPEHLLPLWPLANYDTHAMIGYHAVPFLFDAYRKGFRGFDPEEAYRAMRDTAMADRNQQDAYRRLGYVPWEKPGVPGHGGGTARTLEYAYDDWCIAQMAQALGKTADAKLFSQRALNYRKVWDPKHRFFRSPQADGAWHEPFLPNEVAASGDDAGGYYVEADAWQYMFAVLHDVPGMIRLYGGNRAFIDRLDEFFNADSDLTNWRIDVTGLIGQYAHGNEPDEQCAYLYALAGAPYKTQARVREIQRTQYDNTPEGLTGNDDCGQISAWYVWSAIGLYPVNPAGGIYVIGSPLVQRATVRLAPPYHAGRSFTIITHDHSAYAFAAKMDNYVQAARLNGKPLDRPWITQEELAEGGTLELDMGILPNKSWGAGNSAGAKR